MAWSCVVGKGQGRVSSQQRQIAQGSGGNDSYLSVLIHSTEIGKLFAKVRLLQAFWMEIVRPTGNQKIDLFLGEVLSHIVTQLHHHLVPATIALGNDDRLEKAYDLNSVRVELILLDQPWITSLVL